MVPLNSGPWNDYSPCEKVNVLRSKVHPQQLETERKPDGLGLTSGLKKKVCGVGRGSLRMRYYIPTFYLVLSSNVHSRFSQKTSSQ